MNIWEIFYSAATVNGLFLSAILFKIDKGNKKANIILGVLVLLLSFYLLDNVLGRFGFFNEHPHLLYIVIPPWYLFAPLTYFYFKFLTDKKVKWKSIYILHLIPFLIMLFQYFPFYFLPGEIKLQYATGVLKPPGSEIERIFYSFLSPVQIISYSAFILKNLFDEKISFSIHSAQLSWLKFFFSLLVLFGILIFVLMVEYFITGGISILIKNLPLAVFTITIFSIGYISIIDPDKIFALKSLPVRKSQSNQLLTKQLSVRVTELMSSEKLYLNNELKYSEIASKLRISTRYLTEVLNKEIGKNFNDFINEYRVEEVKNKILNRENENLTLLAIALESGFSSKSSFNRIFKKHTGTTPTEFISTIETTAIQKVS